MTIKHATAGAFVFCQFPQGWRTGLIFHPRFGRHLVPGGHVEDFETEAQAALREVEEESGLRVRLIDPPVPPLPAGYPLPRVAAPWWIIEQPVPADSHLTEDHVHVDHQYLAIAESARPVTAPEHPFAWYAPHQLGGLTMFEDTRMVATLLFDHIDDLAAGRLDLAGLVPPASAPAAAG